MSTKLINKNNLTNLIMLETTKISSRGQVVIPERMRKKLNIKEGAKLIIRDRGNQLIIEEESVFVKNLQQLEEEQEKKGMRVLAQKQLAKLWENKEDEEEWEKYL